MNFFCFFLSLLPGAAFGANILGVFTIPSISHQVVYRNLMLELNKRGHNITVVTPDPVKDPSLKNYREVDMSYYYDLWRRSFIAKPHELRIALKFPEIMFFNFIKVSDHMCQSYLSSPQIRALIEENPKFDLLILEFGFNPCFYGFAKFSEYKYIGMFSMQTNPIVHSNIGNVIDASYIPDVCFPYVSNMSFFERLRTFLFQGFMWILYRKTMSTQTVVAREAFGKDLPHLMEIERNLSVMMVNTHFSVGFPRPNVPNMIEIGGPPFHLIGRKPKPLPKIKLSSVLALTCAWPASISNMIWLPLLVLLTYTKTTDGANILAILPAPSYSHQIFYRVYLKALHERGHNITVATPNPINDPTMANYREIDFNYMYTEFRKVFNASSEKQRTSIWMEELIFVVFAQVISNSCKMMLADPNLMDIYRRNEKFDLFVVEWALFSCVLPFAKLADGKMIGISSFQVGAISHQELGSVWNPAYAADPNLGYSDRMTFFQRLRSTIYHVNAFIFVKLMRMYEGSLARKYFGEDVGNLNELERKVALVFDNSHVTTNYPRATNINHIPLGGPAFHLNGRKPQPLPKDIKDFLDDAPNGVIYFSLGTNVKTDNMSKNVEDILMQSFGRIKQKVLWKWENDKLKVNHKNVKMGKWFPQVDVLAHPNVKAFVTQGGLQSIGEAIENKVPLVALPFFADQNHNARKMELEGAALLLDFDALDVDMFTAALNEIVSNKKYKENMVRMSALVKDQPIPPLEKAVWWTEYVIRHNGAPHLRSTAATLPWYQYFMLDVLAVVFLFIFAVSYIAYAVVRCVFRRFVKEKTD